jgi:hypothetical protein
VASLPTMKHIGAFLIAAGLVLGACGGGGEGPPMPSPEPGKLPGQQTTAGNDLDDDGEDVVEEEPAEDDAAE